jgi:hypothetical protein
MKSVLVSLIVMVLLFAAAEGARRAALVEDVLATADEQLTTTGVVSREVDGQLEEAVALAARLPAIGDSLTRQVRVNRAMQAYWQREYAALSSGPLAAPADETDATLRLLAANAVFRQAMTRTGTPQALARGLDDVLKGYAEVLDVDPANINAAYNYEFTSRLRSALAGGRSSGMPEPESRNMQGEQGDPPEGTRKSDFNVIVPMRPEERQEQLDPGAGNEFKRQG